MQGAQGVHFSSKQPFSDIEMIGRVSIGVLMAVYGKRGVYQVKLYDYM